MCRFPSGSDLEGGAGKLGDYRPLMEQGAAEQLFGALASKVKRAHDMLAPQTPSQDRYDIELPMNYYGSALIQKVLKRIRQETEWVNTSYDYVTRIVSIQRPITVSKSLNDLATKVA